MAASLVFVSCDFTAVLDFQPCNSISTPNSQQKRNKIPYGLGDSVGGEKARYLWGETSSVRCEPTIAYARTISAIPERWLENAACLFINCSRVAWAKMVSQSMIYGHIQPRPRACNQDHVHAVSHIYLAHLVRRPRLARVAPVVDLFISSACGGMLLLRATSFNAQHPLLKRKRDPSRTNT